jgi:arylformamidase
MADPESRHMIIDISQPLSPGMAGFPDDAPYTEGNTFVIGPNCPVNVARFSMSVHCGTHADAPLHYDAKGEPVGKLALQPFIGPCRVIDARGENASVEPRDIEHHLENAPPRILLRLMDKPDPKIWPSGFRSLSPSLIDRLAQQGTTLIGVDTPSIDSETSQDLPCHKIALRSGMRILENLVLAHVMPGDYELIALPINLQNLDAAPVRAILRPILPQN